MKLRAPPLRLSKFSLASTSKVPFASADARPPMMSCMTFVSVER